LASFSRSRSFSSSVFRMYRSSGSNRLAAHSRVRSSASVDPLAWRACRLETPNTIGSRPSSASAFCLTNPITCSMSVSSWMSTLLTTNTTFLPQSRILVMNCRSLSVKGRSAEVTKRMRSARGTKSAVICSCLRTMALVPGVSTMLISCSHSAG